MFIFKLFKIINLSDIKEIFVGIALNLRRHLASLGDFCACNSPKTI